MVESNNVNVKLSDTQLKKTKNSLKKKKKTATTLRINWKMFNENNWPYELFLTTRKKTKVRNAFNNNVSTYLKRSKAQISKIIQSGWFLGSLLSRLAAPLMKVAIPLAKSVLARLGTIAAALAIDAKQNGNHIKNTWFWKYHLNNFKWRNEWCNTNYSSSWRF